MKKTSSLFKLCAFLIAFVALGSTRVWAGGGSHSTHFGKVTVSASGNGSVYIGTSNNAETGNTEETWNCGGNGDNDSKTYYLFAKPDAGYRFTGWSGFGTSSKNPYQVTNSANSTNQGSPSTFNYTATFKKEYTYTANASVVATAGGTASVNGSSTQSSPEVDDSKDYSFTLTATPNDGYVFTGWSETEGGSIISSNTSYTATITCTTSNPNVSKTWYANFREYRGGFSNPILSMDAADPSVILAEDGYWYMYCSEAWSGQGIPVWRSSDLVNWTMVTTLFATRPANVGYTFLWAPEIAYVNKKYVLYYANANYNDQASTQICVATSDNPYGPFENNKILINASSSANGALNARVNNVIDPSLFRDTDGKNYLIWGSFNGVYYVELDASCTSLAAGATKKSLVNGTSGDWKSIEAPMLIHRDGYYYLIASKGNTIGSQVGNDASKIDYRLVMARSTSLGGTFNNVDGNNSFNSTRNLMSVLLQKNDFVLGPGHSSQIIKDKEGTEYVFYHGYPKKSDGTWDFPGSRKLFASKVTYDSNGWPQIDAPTADQLIEVPAIDESKQEASTRKITNATELMQFAADVNAGNPFINAVLMNDIDCSSISNWTPIGKDEDHKFQGIIDGQGHKIMNLRADKSGSNDVALVGVVNGGAQFKNLVIDASCEFKGDNQIAGFVGHAKGTGSIQFLNCGNEAFINASGANASGFLGYTSGISTYWDNCYNTGDITGNRESAAFSAWCGDRLRNCWNTGRTMGTDGADGGKWQSLTRGTITLGYENTYDLNSANNSVTGMPDGYATEWLASGRLAYTMGNTVWMQKIGVDAHPYPFGADKVYASTECGGSTTGYSNDEQGKIHKYNYTLTASQLSSDCTCGATLGTIPVSNDYLQIGNADQLEMAMDYVTNGGGAAAKMQLTADIDFTAKGNKMFGADENGKRFTGEFDGQFHKVTVAYNDGGQRTALFRVLAGATVKNLTVDGTITMKQYNMSGGIFGTATDGAKIDKCISAVTYIDAANHDATFGGLGANTWTAVQISNCAFVGKVIAARAEGNGGFVGYDNSGALATFTNCYVAADINWKGGENYCRNSSVDKFTNCHEIAYNAPTLASGEFCYDVIGGDWTQNLGEDAYPVLNHKKIFINGTYANVDETIELDEAKSFSTKAEFTTNVNMKRTLKANMWNTFCVPFDMANSELGAGAEVKELTGLSVKDDHFTMTFTDASSIEAGKPYMVRVPNAVSMLNLGQKTVKNDIIKATESADGGSLSYVGVFNSGKAPMGSFIISSNKFYLVDSDVNMKAYRGYITAEAANSVGVKALSFIFGDDEETAIENVNITENGSEMTMTFDLSGRRIQKGQKGINIINGKKVMMK